MKPLIVLTIFCFSFTIYAQKSYTILDVPSELSKNANSVLIDEKVEVDVTIPGKLKYSNYTTRVILNKRGDGHGTSYIYYDKGTNIKKCEVYIYDALGNEIEHFRKKDFHDISATDGFSIYNDSRVLYLNYTPTTYPYIVAFKYEFESNSTAGIPDWGPVDWYTKSTLNSTYTLKYNPINKPRMISENLEGLDIIISDYPNKIECKASNIKAFAYESLSVPFSENAPNVSFSLNSFSLKGVSGYAENWQEYGLWIQNSLLNNVSELPESTILKIKNLVKNETTNEAKARIVYKYVQEKVRYISIQIGIGGWKPMLASEVDRLSYGDCKALTNYTKALLDVVGVPSYYTVLYAGEDKQNIIDDFSGLQGNHVILGLPDGENITWLECTSQDTPYGFIGDFCDDRDVLLVKPEGGEIVRTKNYEYHENLEVSEVKVNLDRKGGAIAHYKSISTGLQYGDKYAIVNEKQEDIDKYYKNKWEAINGYTIDSLLLTNNKEEIVFKEDVQIKIPSYTISVGNDILVNVNLFNQNTYIPTRIKDRKYDLHISRGYEDKNSIEINLPSGYKFTDLPQDQFIENQFGTYKVSYQLISENKLLYKRNIIIKKGTFPKEAYQEYRTFKKKVSKYDKTKVIVTKNS